MIFCVHPGKPRIGIWKEESESESFYLFLYISIIVEQFRILTGYNDYYQARLWQQYLQVENTILFVFYGYYHACIQMYIKLACFCLVFCLSVSKFDFVKENDLKTTRKQSENDPKTILKTTLKNPKALWKRSENDP